MLQRLSALQISQGTAHTKYCTFAVLPDGCTDEEWERREFVNRTQIEDGAHLLQTVQALLPAGMQLHAVWLFPLFADGLQTIFQRICDRVRERIGDRGLQDFHAIENFALVADQYMTQHLRNVPVAFQAEFGCTVWYVPREV